MTDEQQQQVLDFAQFLAKKNPVGVPGKNLLQFAGIISTEDAKIMVEAADENRTYALYKLSIICIT